MNKQNAVCVCVYIYIYIYICNGILLSHKNEWNSDTCFNKDEPWKHCIKWNKPVTKGHILYDFIYMKVSEKPFPKLHSAVMPKKLNNALNWPGERDHWFTPQMSGMVTTGATGQLGVVKNYCALQCNIKDWKTWLLKFDGMGREVGGGIRMGNTCTLVADSCWCMAKPIQYCKVASN